MNQDSVQGSDPATAPIMNPADAGLGAIEESSARMEIPDNALTSEQFTESVAAAHRHFSLIRNRYPDLKAYLVLSLPVGQANIGGSPREMITEFPAMFVDGKAKTDLVNFLKIPEPKNPPEAEKWKEQLKELEERLRYDGKTRVELRFKTLDYGLLWKLQSDDLVDRDLTPRTRASIRIALGTISHFAERPDSDCSNE